MGEQTEPGLAERLRGVAEYLEHHEDDAADLRAAADVVEAHQRLLDAIGGTIEEYDGDNITAAAAVVEELQAITGGAS